MATDNETDTLNDIKRFLILCGAFLVILLALVFFSGTFSQKLLLSDDVSEISLTKTNGRTYTQLSSGEVLLTAMNRGDVLTCVISCPECSLAYPSLVFESVRGSISVTNAGRTIYSVESGEASNQTAMINQIPLKDADFSQPITVTVTASERNSIFSVPNFMLIEQHNGFSQFLQARNITFIIAVFMFFLGILGTVICTTSRFLGKKLLPLIHISQFTFWTSLCMFCHLGFILLFIHSEILNTILELLSFYLALASICLVIYPKLLSTRKSNRIFRHFTIAYLVYCVISLLLPFFTNIHVMDTYTVSIVILLAVLLYSVYLCIRQWKTHPEQLSLPVAGFLVLCSYTVAEQIRIMLFSAGIKAFGTPEMIILSFGIIIFTACSLTDYFLWFKSSTIQETVEESWKRFSEPNSEPGISGYQKTLALLHELQESKSQYTIITLSIDNLDELKLSQTPLPLLEDNFARLLYLVFSSYGITGNLGNGKFLAALPDMPEGKVIQLLRALKVLVNRDNDSHPDAKITFSYGYALSSDSDSTEIAEICQLANNSRKVQEQQLLQ
ncbi:MAG: hypothetical protein KBT02_07025 [Treponema sp.]|nr:hypothetical protein [Candidatus Treponema caballi]